MEIDPSSFFKNLVINVNDLKKGPIECLRILEIFYRNLIEEQINSSSIDLYLIHIFEKSNGLTSFLNSTIKIKDFKNAVVKAIEVLHTLVNNFSSRLTESNIIDIYNICNSAIKLNTLSEVKVKALELLLVSLEKLDLYFESSNIVFAYKELFSSIQNALKQKHCDTVKHKELMVLGYFSKQYQYLIVNPRDVRILFERNLDPEVFRPKKSQNIICGFFTGFSWFCESYPLDIEINEDKKLIEKLYKLLYNLVIPTDKLKFGNRAALKFLASNIEQFREFLLKDFRYWHVNLLKWLQMGAEEKKVGVLMLRAFLHTIANLICDKAGEWSVLVKYFNQWAMDLLKKNNVSNYEKHLSIQCLKFFSRSSYRYLAEKDVTDLFLTIMKNFENNYILKYDPKGEEWEYLPDYVQAVANFMQFKTFKASEFYCLQRAVINMIKSFHQLPYLHYYLVIDGIVITCFYLKKTQYFDPFLENIIYQGVLWSCTHHHISNVGLADEINRNLVTVKDFFPLWLGILKLSSNRNYEKYGLSFEDRKYILERIVNQLVKTLMITINKLNLSVKLKEENIALTEVEKAYQLEHMFDHAIFLNVVDLYEELFENIEPRMFKKCICKMIKHILNKCVNFPLISGFYKLLSYCLKIANKLNIFDEDADPHVTNVKETLRRFLEMLLDKMTQYKDELLIACLKVLLESPVILIQDMLPICVTPFVEVFIIGRSYLPLAEMGLNTLSHWQESVNNEEFDLFISKIIPHLDSYLRSKSLLGQTQSNSTEPRRKTAQVLNKRKVVLEMEPELMKLQRKILSFIGNQSSEVCHAFVYPDEFNEIIPTSIHGGKHHLKVTLPYEDIQVNIYLDVFVPRVVNLALYSSDRKTKITACELLQAIIMVFLGRGKPMIQTGLQELEDLLRTVSMPLLQLGCDVDQLVQQIFSPLVFQLIHWYASPSQLRGSHTAIMIDTLMEGITHPTNSSLRDFSGNCIEEFVKWTIKQISEEHLSADPINIKILIKKMRFFSSHSDPTKKLGAALIFNNIYREMREEESLINIFWVEILHIFVSSLSLIENNSVEDGNTVMQIKNALNHLERVILEKPHIFRVSDEKRRIPSDISGGTLKDVSVWLLKQTGNSSRHCREASMNLFVAIRPLMSSKKTSSKNFVMETFQSAFIRNVYEHRLELHPSLEGISHSEDCSVLFKWMQSLCCALDGYNFVIKHNLCDINFENNTTIKVVDYFLESVLEADMAEALNLIDHKSWAFTTLDMEQFKKEKAACILGILKLYNTILLDEILLQNSTQIWNSNFWKLLLKTVFDPQQLGLDDRISQPKYLEILTVLLNNLPRKIPENISPLIENLHLFIDKNFVTKIDLKTNVTLLQRNIINGLLLLNSTNVNKQIKLEPYIKGLINNLMESFYSTLNENVLYINDFPDTTLEYCNLIFKLSLTNLNELKLLINHLHGPYLVQSMEFCKEIKFGPFILNVFGDTVIPFLLNNFDFFLNSSLETGSLNITVDLVMIILNLIGKCRSYKHYFDSICKSLLDKWSTLEALFNSQSDHVHLGLDFVKLLFSICNLPCVRDVEQWLFNLLLQDKDLSNSYYIFYLLEETVDDDKIELRPDLERALTSLFDKISSVETERANFLFEKMLNTIHRLKSTVMFKFLITYYGKLDTHIEVEILLKKFMNYTKIQTQQTTLRAIYEMSKDAETSFESRYRLIKNIVPPLFQNCHRSCFENFFVEHINDISCMLQNSDAVETNILNFVLIELLFLRIPIGSSERTVCSISDAAKNPKLLKFFLKHVLEAFKKATMTSKEILRLYKCHAYNALASIVSNSVKSENCYEKLFERQENGKDILWNGIIDTSVTFDFPIFFDSIPSQRKIIINIRDELRAKQRQNENKSKSLRYIESQKLFSSSLSEDVTNFDFTNATLRSQKVDEEQNDISLNCQSEIQLDAVAINNHECMATVCGLIQHIFDTGVNDLPQVGDEEIILPNWIQSIRSTLLNDQTHRNIKLFLVKVIDNTINIFNYYAQAFLEPLLQFIVDKCAGDNLNYFVIDVVCILAKWSSMIKPNEKERKLAGEMLLFLISNLSNERVDMFKYNLDLIKLLVESWKEYIEVPSTKLFEILSSESKCEIGIHLTSIFLVNNLKPWQDNKTDEFMTVLLQKINSSKKSTYKSCAETIGLMVKYLNGQYSARVDTCLKAIKDFNKYVYCLEGVAIHFPQLVKEYHVSKLLCSLNQFPDSQKIIHLKIILRRVEKSLDILDDITDFKIVEWPDLLESSNLEIQIITLKIIKTCLRAFMSYKIYPDIVNTLRRNITSSNALYRNGIYDIAILIYRENKDISDICKEILIFGLIDGDADNKENVINFWKENSNIPRTLVERFSYLLSNLYKAKMEEHFLSYVNYFLIAILNTRDEYNTELFEHPLENCNFEDYRLQLNWRLQHPSVVPLFAETFIDTEQGDLYDNSDAFQLRETQANFSFAQTQSMKEQEFSKYTNLESSLSINISDSDSSIKNPNDLILSQKYRFFKPRFLKDKSKISIMAAHSETKKQVKKVERRRDLAKEREKKVTIYRNYRKGDFPDIQILLSSVLEPLQMLSLQDGEVAKILLTEIFKGIISKVGKNDAFTQSVLDSIQYIFNNSTTFNPNLIGTLLDILLSNKDKFHLDQPQLISYVCQQSGLLSIGTLLLEEYIISGDNLPPESKKGPSVEQKEITYWVKLTELYKELEEWDMVRAIFLEKMNCKDYIQNAIQYESQGQWRNAQELYAELIETDVSAERKDFYYDSYFKCFANLGEWQELPKEIESVVSSTSEDIWTSLWDKDWCQQKLLPWYIKAQVKNTLFNQQWPEEFAKNLNESFNCAEKAEYIQTNFSEELSVLWLYKKDISNSKLYLNNYIKHFLSNWQLLNPMYESLRYDKILQLRNVIEIDLFISIYKNLSQDVEETLNDLLAKWENAQIEILPSILLNETRVLYRTLFLNTLKDKLINFAYFDTNHCLENIEKVTTKINMSLIETAIELNNYYISKKYLKKYATQENLKCKLAFGNLIFLRSEMVADPQKKLQLLIEAVENFELIFSISQDPFILLPANMKIFDTFDKISHLTSNNQVLFLQIQKALASKFDTKFNTPDDINKYASKKLRLAIENFEDANMDCDTNKSNSILKHVANAYVKLAYFTKDMDDQNIQKDFILYVLRAMKLNSLEAKQLFPCILIQNRLDANCTKLFIHETDKIPTWMFLGWIPQLLANLDSTKIHALSKIVTRIAETYPQAIMYPYRLSKEHYRFTDKEVAEKAQPLIKKLDSLLLNDAMVDTFLKALSYVGVPTVILRYHVEKMYKETDDIKNIQEIVTSHLYKERPNSKNINNMQGNMYETILKYKNNIKKILSEGNVTDALLKLNRELKKEVKTSSMLKDYCPWLANFSANKLNLELEIPGQYTGDKLPLPQHHIKISGFHPNVTVMSSLRQPIKLTIIGMDTKEYPFLIKFGEDIRQDQRIEQLFGLMNDIYKSDGTCNSSNLEILTYQVIPLTSSLGMIQWVNDTQSLSEFIKKSLTKKELDDFENIRQDYCKWIGKNNNPAIAYGSSAVKLNRNKTITFYRSLANRIPWDILRKSFWSLSSNTENFIALRNNFIKSYAVLCASQWILGIGDRHLDNSKICIRNGKVLGIDFGHAFGTATQILPVPELVPFRLTPHIINLMEPLKERGPFRQFMIHSLRALRANHKSLLATMNVFIEEPSLDWLEHAVKSENAGEGTHDWYPKTKVNQTKRKLEGASSVKILVEDLKAGRKDPKFIEAYVKLVEGSAEFDKRANLRGDDLSIEEQVDCLLDHAIDYNLLGRMWQGWMPWV